MLYSNCTSLQTLFNTCMTINCSVLFTLYIVIDSLCSCLMETSITSSDKSVKRQISGGGILSLD